jgi:hypothetical protein
MISSYSWLILLTATYVPETDQSPEGLKMHRAKEAQMLPLGSDDCDVDISTRVEIST